jgi:hypothetical protein
MIKTNSYRQRLPALLSGLVLSFAICSVAGHWMPEKLEHFTRFHIFVSPDSFFYPTVRAVYNTARSIASRKKPFVVLGGSSVIYGAGQPPGKTIADFLQSALGRDYTVMNLAMRGGDVAGMGLFVAEAMRSDGYDVYYVADTLFGARPRGSNRYFDYIYWQYRYEPFVRWYSPRDDVGEKMWTSNVGLGRWLNAAFRFDNLWNQIAYDRFFTVYSKFMHQKFWQPRGATRDPEFETPKGYFYQHANIDREAASVAQIGGDISEEDWGESRLLWNATIAPQMRPRSLLVLCKKDPRVTARLDQALQEKIANLYTEAVKRYRAAGFNADEPCKSFEPDDYADPTHLSPEGAKKMATEIAVSIRQMARGNP